MAALSYYQVKAKNVWLVPLWGGGQGGYLPGNSRAVRSLESKRKIWEKAERATPLLPSRKQHGCIQNIPGAELNFEGASFCQVFSGSSKNGGFLNAHKPLSSPWAVQEKPAEARPMGKPLQGVALWVEGSSDGKPLRDLTGTTGDFHGAKSSFRASPRVTRCPSPTMLVPRTSCG